MQRNSAVEALQGIAQELHFPPRITGSDAQHDAQQEACRSRHGSSPEQMTHGACRTIRAVSRPNISNAERTADIVIAHREGVTIERSETDPYSELHENSVRLADARRRAGIRPDL